MSQPTGQPGSEGQGTGTQSGTDGATGTDPQQQTGTGTQSGTDPGQQQQGQQPTKTAAELQAELDATIRRMKAADQTAAAQAAKLKEYEDKNLSEQEKLKRDAAEAKAEAVQLQKDKEDLTLRLAFLADTTYQWRNPEHALRLVDLSEVEQKDGKITGLKEAAKKLAEEHKYLLAPKEGEEGDSGEGGPGPKPPEGSTVPMTGQRPSSAQASREALAKQFPALRTRGIS